MESSSPVPARGTRKASRIPRTQRYKFSTTGTEVAHIETIEADPALKQFPSVLIGKIKRYLEANAYRGEEIELTFAKNGNTKLHVSGEGFPAYFVIPETTQKLDAARYRYGLVKGSPLIMVVKEREDSAMSFNRGQPAIVLYHGKHSSIKGPNKISKWVVWDVDGVRSDIIVWRVAEGANRSKSQDDDDDMAEGRYEESFEVDTPEHQVFGLKQELLPTSSAERAIEFESGVVEQSDNEAIAHNMVPENDIMMRDAGLHANSLPVDPRLLFLSSRIVPTPPDNYFAMPGQPINPPAGVYPNDLVTEWSQNNVNPAHRPYHHNLDYYTCHCRDSIQDRRNAQMAAATDKVLLNGCPCHVSFSFRLSLGCETRLKKRLEDCRTMPHLFAYGRLHRTILISHNVISIHFINADSGRAPIHMVLDDVSQWRALMIIIEREMLIKERNAKKTGKEVGSLDLVVIDEGY